MKLLTSNEIQFKKDCKVINLNYEYPGYTGQEKWGIITALTEIEITNKYAQQIQNYKPFIILSPSYGILLADYIRNENKYHMRSSRNNNGFDFSEHTEEHHLEISYHTLEDELIEKEEILLIHDAISKLNPLQRERIIKYFFEKTSLRQIAIEECKAYATIHESYKTALKNLKKILETPDNLPFLSGNK